jgi:hypothetical protein
MRQYKIQRSKLRAVTLIGILPCLGEREGRRFIFLPDGSLIWLAVCMVSAEMLNYNLLSTQAAGIKHLYISFFCDSIFYGSGSAKATLPMVPVPQHWALNTGASCLECLICHVACLPYLQYTRKSLCQITRECKKFSFPFQNKYVLYESITEDEELELNTQTRNTRFPRVHHVFSFSSNFAIFFNFFLL